LRKIIHIPFVIALLMAYTQAFAQPDTSISRNRALLEKISESDIARVETGIVKIKQKFEAAVAKALNKWGKKEKKLKRKLASRQNVDSILGALRDSSGSFRLLAQLQSGLHRAPSAMVSQYIPGLDSLQTLTRFFTALGSGIPGFPAKELESLRQLTGRFTALQQELRNAADVEKFLKERAQLLTATLQNSGLGRDVLTFKKELYYYQAQISEYKQLLNDPGKAAQKLLGLARTMPAFKEFMSRNSQLAQFFMIPGASGNVNLPPGLQSRTAIQAQLSTVGAGINPQQMLDQQVQAAEGELNKLKDQVNKFGGMGNGDLPTFTPNTQRSKSFLKRFEYGISIQSQRPNALLPVTSDIVLTAGYKMNDKSTIGLGIGYKLGWGKSFREICLSTQGISFRSFIDLKIKGNFWISGGYEKNYQQELIVVDQFHTRAWQESGLIGLTKKYRIGKKNGNLQLLWDFLSYSQMPPTRPLKFRLGYQF
jgi:hypothetical protein